MQRQRKEPMRKEIFIRFRLIFFSGLAVALTFVIMLSVESAERRHVERIVAEKQEALQLMKAEAVSLEHRLAFMGTDEYVAQEARRRFGYLEPGERRYHMEGIQAQAYQGAP